jgi:hypothetical protein
VRATTYIVLPTTKGAASWPWFTPIENLQATCSRSTLSGLIWSSSLARVLA